MYEAILGRKPVIPSGEEQQAARAALSPLSRFLSESLMQQLCHLTLKYREAMSAPIERKDIALPRVESSLNGGKRVALAQWVRRQSVDVRRRVEETRTRLAKASDRRAA